MLKEFQDRLTPVRMRQQFDRGFRGLCAGALVGAVLGCFALLLWRFEILHITASQAWIALFASAITGFAVGLLWPSSWRATAMAIDEACNLKDRTSTALCFAKDKQHNAIRQLQMEDAMQHLSKIDAHQVVPFQVPRLGWAALALMAAMMVLAILPAGSKPMMAKSIDAFDVAAEQAQLLEETLLKNLEELAEENPTPELVQLLEEMKEAVEELRAPQLDQREALAKLSEMQQAVAEMAKQMDVQQVDAQLQQLAEALQAAEATSAAAKSLATQDYDNAAEKLEKIDASTMNRKEREAITESLAKISKELGEGKKGKLSEGVKELKEGLEHENQSLSKAGLTKTADVCRTQSLKKKIGESLGSQLARLAECKSNCQGNKSGNNPNANKSNTPKNTWGTGKSGQATGDKKTELESQRHQEQLSGASGDGPSEKETTSSPEGRQAATRDYQQRYREYKRQMEEVLDSEPLPLGDRQTVRRYFESIRPSNEEATEANVK